MGFKEIEIGSETQLEEILINNPSVIEDDFKVLKSQRRTPPSRKRLDLLGVDSKGTLTVLELKTEEDNEQILQALEYFDWLMERGLSFFREHSSEPIENRTPRIILIAPSFDERTVKACKYILEDIQVSLKRIVLSYEVQGKKYVKLIDEKIPSRKEIEQPPSTIEDHINWIKNEDVKSAFRETITMIEHLDPDNIRINLLPYRINFIHKSKGLKFAELYSRRNYFWIHWKEDPEWGEAKVDNLQEAKRVVSDKVAKAMEAIREAK